MRTLFELVQGRQCDALQVLMGPTCRQAKGPKENKSIHSESVGRAVPQSGCHGRGEKGLASLSLADETQACWACRQLAAGRAQGKAARVTRAHGWGSWVDP